ncbi:iron ABC transporter permease [Nisaea acidiphila]|uniref:Iron ABC transporter permease n=1 Tax=Nisaea acidiphila TaxID=1862145 RepID=A0A9J7APE1_9PROT|nr:iron ABC transporter permease [Nisaea acidiphila]UUX49280.1 iron ABC transporter permease [Nisaea acidiphila]
MNRRNFFWAGSISALLFGLALNLSAGSGTIGPDEVFAALFSFDPEQYEHFVVLYQRVPRALIAVQVGATMACAGAVLQGLTRNPLAAPATLGISAGATVAVLIGVYLFDLGTRAQGMSALAGGVLGFLACIAVTRLVARARDPRGLTLILSGALVSMLQFGIANALLLSDPSRRTDFLAWVTGNINHFYADRLAMFWWIGALALLLLFTLARPLTLITVGTEKAASAGVNVPLVSGAALIAVAFAASSSVAICGPVAFIGLIVPHMIRPFLGGSFRLILPAAALTGATVCLLADLVARTAFSPYLLHTGIVMDLLGGAVFILIVKRRYLTARTRRPA